MNLDCSDLVAVVEVQGAGVGLVLTEMVVVKVDSEVVCAAVGLETGVVQLSLAAEERLAAGREGAGVEKVLERLGGVLGFSLSHAGPSLAGVGDGVFVLVLVDSGGKVTLETGVFVGKSLGAAGLLAEDSDLKDRKHKVKILLTLAFMHKGSERLTFDPINGENSSVCS